MICQRSRGVSTTIRLFLGCRPSSELWFDLEELLKSLIQPPTTLHRDDYITRMVASLHCREATDKPKSSIELGGREISSCHCGFHCARSRYSIPIFIVYITTAILCSSVIHFRDSLSHRRLSSLTMHSTQAAVGECSYPSTLLALLPVFPIPCLSTVTSIHTCHSLYHMPIHGCFSLRHRYLWMFVRSLLPEYWRSVYIVV